ncbi:uncharacterized protein B0T23DRAFT_176046 [Neurospora hispaniola]|uniref:Uncharacterized protein n=1 Tax=Neurospora hispaniola TaxID=588809 RepID=A0AAJ0I6D7_9PEZI|nr:hypothetical protein B0T23DRAFT_176046 [Neurospora hispaniola]
MSPACAACQVTSATPPSLSANIQLSHVDPSSRIASFCWAAVFFWTTLSCLNTTHIRHSMPSRQSTLRPLTFPLSPACNGHPMPGRARSIAAYLDLSCPRTSSPYPPPYHIHLSFHSSCQDGKPSHYGCNRRARSVSHTNAQGSFPLLRRVSSPLSALIDKSPPSSFRGISREYRGS